MMYIIYIFIIYYKNIKLILEFYSFLEVDLKIINFS